MEKRKFSDDFFALTLAFIPQISLRPMVTELVSSARQLYEESCELLREKAHNLVSIFECCEILLIEN